MSSDGTLSVDEVNSEIAALNDDIELDSTPDSIVWEDQKAQVEYGLIEAETSREFELSGFSSSESNLASKEHFDHFNTAVNLTRSAPSSPQQVHSKLTVKKRVQSYENLSQGRKLEDKSCKRELVVLKTESFSPARHQGVFSEVLSTGEIYSWPSLDTLGSDFSDL